MSLDSAFGDIFSGVADAGVSAGDAFGNFSLPDLSGQDLSGVGSFIPFLGSVDSAQMAAQGAGSGGWLSDWTTALNQTLGIGTSGGNPLTPSGAATPFTPADNGGFLKSLSTSLGVDWGYDPKDQAAASAASPTDPFKTGGDFSPAKSSGSIFPWNALGTAISATNPFGYKPQQQQASVMPLLLIGLVVVLIVAAGGKK